MSETLMDEFNKQTVHIVSGTAASGAMAVSGIMSVNLLGSIIVANGTNIPI